MEDSLKEKLKDESLTVKEKNGKFTVNTSVKGENKTYILEANLGEAYEYKDPFDYGSKTKETLALGDDITLGTEKFRVFYNKDGVIKAMPWYNITLPSNLKEELPIQSSTAGVTEFSTSVYWTFNDDKIDMDDSSNVIQKYIKAYKEKLENLGAEHIIVRACRSSEISSELGAELETPLTDSQKQNIRNPGKTGNFWLGSGAGNRRDYVLYVLGGGTISGIAYSSATTNGVRPIIIIEY